MPRLFDRLFLREVNLGNRIAVSPCANIRAWMDSPAIGTPFIQAAPFEMPKAIDNHNSRRNKR
jgi:hypothetical protein